MGIRVLLVLVLVGACAIAFAPTARADDGADGRRHAKRASHLSASGKCKQAVAEYDKALAVMRDPALLFNRGECHRKLGDFDAALADYNQFLADLPKAPNRAEVEARIAEMRKASAPGSVAAPASAVSRAGRASSERSGGGVAATPPSAQLVPSTTGTMGGGDAPSARAPLLGVQATESPRVAGAPGGHAGAGTDLTPFNNNGPAAPEAAAGPADDSLTGHAWFWVAVAAAAVGFGVGTYAILSQEHTSIPPSPLGNYRF